MALKQTMNMSQNLVITPQLQQAIKLLQLSRMELETAVQVELDENPILEETVDLKEEDFKRTAEAAREAESLDSGPNESTSQDPQKQDEFDWESYVDMSQKPSNTVSGNNEEINSYENLISTSETLQEHLIWQMKMNGFNEEEERAAELIIDAIDDDGYLKTSLDVISTEEKVDRELLDDVLSLIQEFDPPGVGARDLKECLLLQAKNLQEDTNDIKELIDKHLKDLEKRNYEGIAKALNKDVQDVIEMCKIIFAMDPKPGRVYASQDTHYVTPDIYVYKVGDEYVVALNEDGLPRLKISNYYKNMLKGAETNDKTQEYIKEKLKSYVPIKRTAGKT
ncbi:MAG TPA: RNA polymerase sigma-54 factor, partial [Pseudobdellovibrionaceae bacterium]|nr:RNA polymerase sigma-54 factor [Pseudobdellovibrionaceae bacterium]